ncbi:winged helix-turn-helix transcriptional regulator [Kitasatospora sp. NPDC101155]|uniref:winged helix-turn-helix transcriptional regulator n=1 Tax=Kitasatospora sp. NPDC101155 TaxID=3364097 RepID=UPI00381CC9CE
MTSDTTGTADTPATARAAVPGRPCSMAAALQVVGEKWALLAVRELFYGNHRFDRIARNTGAPRDRLTARLRALEEAGVVERRPYSERPPRYEYHLTEAGRDLAPLAHALRVWGDRWLGPDSPVTFAHEPEGHQSHPFDPAWVCRTCGREVRRGELHAEVHTPGWTVEGPVEL